jgi:hypothetical protein
MEHDQLVEATLTELALPILRFIYKYHFGYEFSQEVFKNGKRFMENIPSHFGTLVKSLSDELIQEIKEKKDDICHEIIRLISKLILFFYLLYLKSRLNNYYINIFLF